MFGRLGGDRQRLTVQIRKKTITPLLRSFLKKTCMGRTICQDVIYLKSWWGAIFVCEGRGIGTTEVGMGGKGGGDLWKGLVTGTL